MTSVGQKGSLRKIAYGSVYRPGIDLAALIAVGSAVLDIAAMFLPWLVGINSVYTPGRGLNYTVTLLLSGMDLFSTNPYLFVILVAPALTVVLVLISLRDEGIMPPRVKYQTKSRILLFFAALCSMLPSLNFVNDVMVGSYGVPDTGVFVGRGELGGAATMPLYAGFGFFFALGLRILKE
jgi:hypothetical protein